MTKLTDMCATTRRSVARDHRVKANLVRVELDKIVGFTPRSATLIVQEKFHTAQAKLWDLAASQAEANGFVRLT